MKVLLALLCLVLTVSGQQFNTYFRPSYPMVRSFVRYRGIPSTHSFTIVPQTQRVISSYRPLKHRTIPRINPITQHMIVPTTTTFSQRGFVPTALLPGLAPMPSGISKSAALSVRALPPDESHRGWRVAIPARLPGPTYTPLGFVSTNGQVIESSTSDMTGTGQDILTKSTGINGNGQETLTTSGVDGLITQDIVYPSQRESESITIAREEMTGQNEGYVTTDDTSVGQTASKKPTEYKTKTSTSKRRRQLELKLKRLRAAKAAKRAARKAAMKAAKKAEKKIIKTTTSYVRKSAPATSLLSPERQAALRQLQEKSLQLLASLAAESATSSTPTHSHTRGVGRPGGVQTINIHMKSGHVPGHQNIGRGAVDAQILSILKQIEQSGGYTHSHGSAGMNYEELTALLRQLQPLQERTLQEVSSGGGLVGNGDDILKQRIIQTTANTGRAIGPDLDSGTNGAGGSDITEFFKTLKQTSVSGENHGVGITQGFTQTGGVGSTAELAALLQQLEQSGIGQSGGPNSNSELASLLNRVGHSGLVSGQGKTHFSP
ncbi:uncharacterized protein [Argopecten irradians]|uniref:uncharacterized protein n=1 Tax=Argopecten irradians TaxID=31199 RepID=UPI0037169820